MTCRVGVLSTESRSECVDITECLCISLTVELTAYSKVGLFAKEILAVVYSTCLLYTSNRNPVETEIPLMDTWIKTYGFSMEIIQEACSRTVRQCKESE